VPIFQHNGNTCFEYNGSTYFESELLPAGKRLDSSLITDGIMREIAVDFNGVERHLPLFTASGKVKRAAHWAAQDAALNGPEESPACRDARASRNDAPDTILIVDENGLPVGAMDAKQIQDDGLNLALTLAAHCGDEARTEQILSEHLMRHGTQGIGYVLTAAIKHMTNDILAGAFDVMEVATGAQPRAKMAEIAGMKDAPAGAWA